MTNAKTEDLLNEIGRLLAEDREYPYDTTLLYADLYPNAVGASIFKDLGNHILYRRTDYKYLGGALLDLWETQGTVDRWSEMEYVFRDGKFEVTYTYPDEIDPKEDSIERRDRIVRRHFGEKPILYPPWPDDDEPIYDI